jgi:peptide/nickel transport system permease protein
LTAEPEPLSAPSVPLEDSLALLPSALGEQRAPHKVRPWAWVGRRCLYAILVLIAISIVTFLATQALPGNAAQAILGRGATPQSLAAVSKQLGLDRSLPTQYFDWIKGVVTGNLGQTLAAPQVPVTSLVGDPLRNTITLLFLTAVIAIPLSFLLGAVAAINRDSRADRVGLGTAVVLTSLPDFVVGMILVMVFATTILRVLPAVTLFGSGAVSIGDWKSLVLPVSVLTVVSVPYLYRQVRLATIEVLESDYVHMARLKGLSNRRVLFAHALPNALVPAIQASTLVLAYLLGGVIIVEYLFNYPGLGSLLLAAVHTRDLPLIQASVLIFAAGYLMFNLLADVLTVLATPRLRTGAVTE